MTQYNQFFTTDGVNLIGGGKVYPDQLQDIHNSQLRLYCADAGMIHATAAGLNISGVIGDLDTVGPLKDAPFPVEHDLDQTTTDLEKSLNLIQAKYIICYGFLGDRMDHSLAAFNAISKSKQPVFLIGEKDVCVICPRHLTLTLPLNTRFSLFPMSPTSACSVGLKWNVDGINMAPYGTVSTSNETIENKVEVWIKRGIALVIFPNAVLPEVINQWPD